MTLTVCRLVPWINSQSTLPLLRYWGNAVCRLEWQVPDAAFFPPFFVLFIQCTMSHLCTSVQKHLYICLMCTVNLNLIFSFCLTHTHKYPFTHCLYFSFFMWTQYTPLVARKPFEHFFPPIGRHLITHLYVLCVCVFAHVHVQRFLRISPERGLAKLSSGTAPLSSPVITMNPSPCLTEDTGSAVLWLLLSMCERLLMLCGVSTYLHMCAFMFTTLCA